jgi:hypothetical protein
MTEEELAAIEADHQGSYCRDEPCFALRLVAEVRRLRRRLAETTQIAANASDRYYALHARIGGADDRR